MWSADEVRELRAKMGLSRSDFARLLGVDARTVHRWEDPEGPRPKGSPAQILAGIHAQIEREPKQAKQVIKVLASAAAVGGLAYLMTKLLGHAVRSLDGSATRETEEPESESES